MEKGRDPHFHFHFHFLNHPAWGLASREGGGGSERVVVIVGVVVLPS